MVKHLESTRSMERGLREKAPSLADSFSPSMVQKWEKVLQRVLADNTGMNRKVLFFLEYSLAVCEFRLAKKEGGNTTDHGLRIDRETKKGHSLGFSQEDLGAINRIFLPKSLYELQDLCQKLKARGIK